MRKDTHFSSFSGSFLKKWRKLVPSPLLAHFHSLCPCPWRFFHKKTWRKRGVKLRFGADYQEHAALCRTGAVLGKNAMSAASQKGRGGVFTQKLRYLLFSLSCPLPIFFVKKAARARARGEGGHGAGGRVEFLPEKRFASSLRRRKRNGSGHARTLRLFFVRQAFALRAACCLKCGRRC